MPRERPGRSGVDLREVRPSDASLVPPERDVLTGRRAVVDRSDKDRTEQADATHVALSSGPPTAGARKAASAGRGKWWVAAAAGAALVVAGTIGAIAATGGFTGLGGADPVGTSGPGPVEAGGGGSGSGEDLPPELDPARITGYTASWTRVLAETGPGHEIPAESAAGSTGTLHVPCEQGVCIFRSFGFQAGAQSVSVSGDDLALFDDGGPCQPASLRLELSRASDGSYTGTLSREPAQLYGAWTTEDGAAAQCWATRALDEVRLVPVLGAAE